jgi:NADPH:quinone reductase-like Zn-dependent oxidoreductase
VNPDAVLVRVRATSVNAYDWHMMRGKPYFARLTEGLLRPRSRSVGVDAAGVVEAVGADVAGLAPGDAVFGARNGAFAEYVSGRNFVRIPAGLSFEEAAAIPVAGVTALQAIRDKAAVRPGQRVLVTGAGGGVGTFAVQIAKALGADVTAATSAAKLEVVRSLGPDRLIEYTESAYRSGHGDYDAVIDVAANRPLRSLVGHLVPDGTLVMVAPGPGQWIGPIARVVSGAIRSRLGRRRFVPFLSRIVKDDLVVLRDLVEAGKIRPVIEQVYRFEDVREAVRRAETGEAQGKVVITT